MKKIFFAAATLLALVLASTSCNMDTKLYNQSDANKGAEKVQDVEVLLGGVMNELGGHRFLGRNVIALSDMCSDIAVANPSTGHFVDLNTWQFLDTDGDLNAIYTSGFVVIHNATLGIIDANRLMDEAKKKEAEATNDAAKATAKQDQAKLSTALSQLYGLKAYAYFYLTTIFSKAYSPAHLNELGMVLVPNDATIVPKTQLTRASVKDTWAFILDLLAKAQSFENTQASPLFINPVNLKALEARVHLYMRNWAGAAEAADAAIAKLNPPIAAAGDYYAKWQTTAVGPEDVFTIAKADNDNLSANALNTLYGSYKGAVSPAILTLFGEKDFRKAMIKGTHPMKYDGTATAQAVSNIPVMRTSELYLIAAEAYAMQGNLEMAKTKLLPIASRNAEITSADKLPAGKDELLKFIADERVRELFVEGHRLYDLRRTEATANIGSQPDYKPYNFVFPIPDSEIKSGFMTQQNEDWRTNFPKR